MNETLRPYPTYIGILVIYTVTVFVSGMLYIKDNAVEPIKTTNLCLKEMPVPVKRYCCYLARR